jgi:hypothetical protein
MISNKEMSELVQQPQPSEAQERLRSAFEASYRHVHGHVTEFEKRMSEATWKKTVIYMHCHNTVLTQTLLIASNTRYEDFRKGCAGVLIFFVSPDSEPLRLLTLDSWEEFKRLVETDVCERLYFIHDDTICRLVSPTQHQPQH